MTEKPDLTIQNNEGSNPTTPPIHFLKVFYSVETLPQFRKQNIEI